MEVFFHVCHNFPLRYKCYLLLKIAVLSKNIKDVGTIDFFSYLKENEYYNNNDIKLRTIIVRQNIFFMEFPFNVCSKGYSALLAFVT